MAAIRCTFAWIFRAVFLAATGLLLLGTTQPLHAQTGTLQSIRNDVRDGPPPSPASSSPASTPSSSNQSSSDNSDDSPTDLDTLLGEYFVGAILVGGVVTSPIWVPHVLLDDNFAKSADLHQFPYDDTTYPAETFPFALRFDADYVDGFDNLDRFNGHLLVSTASRLEFDARCQHLSERLAGGGEDQLWNGDCNLTWRFAQSDHAQFRAGLGMNWLNDPAETNIGFNFTYGADLFLARPFVLSAVLDAGTLGHAGLFRFRTTAGVIYRSVELYSGYEYTDIGTVHWNGLVGGVRLWF